jgi:endonuclease G
LEQKVSEEPKEYPEPAKDEVSLEFGDNFLPTSTTGVIVTHAFFTLSYVEKHEQAEWVAYELRKEHIKRNDFKRPYFIQDKDVKTKSADWRNYKKSGYDRGHLCPAGDRSFDYEAYFETFLTSNISPQDHSFNAGVWNSLEQKTRYWAGRYNDVYVITGGVLKDGLKTIGTENVSVPEAFYKIIIDKTNGRYKVAAFLIPQAAGTDSFYKYMTTVDEIEAKTGIDFFAQLPDAIENKIEAERDTKFWK